MACQLAYLLFVFEFGVCCRPFLLVCDMTCLLTNAGRFSTWRRTFIVVALLAFTHAGTPVIATCTALRASTRGYCPIAYTAGAVAETALNVFSDLVDWISDARSQGHTKLQSLVKCLDHRDTSAVDSLKCGTTSCMQQSVTQKHFPTAHYKFVCVAGAKSYTQTPA